MDIKPWEIKKKNDFTMNDEDDNISDDYTF
jgi:hypothetical protein